jgi:hypothetical protein
MITALLWTGSAWAKLLQLTISLYNSAMWSNTVRRMHCKYIMEKKTSTYVHVHATTSRHEAKLWPLQNSFDMSVPFSSTHPKPMAIYSKNNEMKNYKAKWHEMKWNKKLNKWRRFKATQKAEQRRANLFSCTENVVCKIKKLWMSWGWIMCGMTMNDRIRVISRLIQGNQPRWLNRLWRKWSSTNMSV